MELQIPVIITIFECPVCGRLYYSGEQCIDYNEVKSCRCGFSDRIDDWPQDQDEVVLVVSRDRGSIDYVIRVEV